MKILATVENGWRRDVYFPEKTKELLEKLGDVSFNPNSRPFTEAELMENIEDADVCVTTWECPMFTDNVLQKASRLRLIAHAAGSVADLVTEHVYKKGIKVCSANDIMAKYVAEGEIAYILSALRLIPLHDRDMKNGVLCNKRIVESKSLYNEKIGMVGLGTVGRYLLELLKPFSIRIRLFDPYVNKASLEGYPEVELCPLDEALSWGNIISVHASLTPETYHMIDADKLKLIRDGALLVNTARGAVIDQNALEMQLLKGRFHAALDVFEEEPLPLDNPLRYLDNVLLMPHMAASPARENMTYAVIDEIQRFINKEPLKHEITVEKYRLMTREGATTRIL